ncbi:hypothetical protein DVS77_17430 [Mycolicibacterium moriokaense]|nr:hypothetical protein DVS77_17430 [Mycolicibacterium moriokaense]
MGWHPPRVQHTSKDGDTETPPGEPTAPFTPTFTGEVPVVPTETPAETPPEPDEPPSEVQSLRRWTLVLVLAAVWVVAAAIGLGLFYWWFHSINKEPAVFVVLVYLVVCTVAALIAAMVGNRPAMAALGVALMSAPFASMASAAVLYGVYFCEHASRCLVGVLPY